MSLPYRTSVTFVLSLKLQQAYDEYWNSLSHKQRYGRMRTPMISFSVFVPINLVEIHQCINDWIEEIGLPSIPYSSFSLFDVSLLDEFHKTIITNCSTVPSDLTLMWEVCNSRPKRSMESREEFLLSNALTSKYLQPENKKRRCVC